MITTKQQEREALTKIQKIVEALGEDSYIGTAFEGVFAIAAENIENDSAASAIEYKELYNESLEKVREAEHMVFIYKDRIEALENLLKESEEKVKNLRYERDEAGAKLKTAFMNEHGKVEAAELENIKLKAKLYDLTVNQK